MSNDLPAVGATPARMSIGVRARAGFTAIELMVVVTVMILLVAMTAPAIYPAIKKGTVHDAAGAIQRAASQAKQLARTRIEPASSGGAAVRHYGVAIVVPTTGPAYATVIYGDGDPTNFGSIAGWQKNPLTGRDYFKLNFNRGVMPYKMAGPPASGGPGSPAVYTFMPTGSSMGWYYQYRTGFLIQNPATNTALINVGTLAQAATPAAPPLPALKAVAAGIPPVFGVATLDQRYVVAVAVYSIGMMNIQDLF
jgi:type II secretory pathway pseudopilin PulG